jgi:hypothetical protein
MDGGRRPGEHLAHRTHVRYDANMDRRSDLEGQRRSLAMLPPFAPNAIGREEAMRLIEELQAATQRLDDLRRRLRELAEEE